LSELREEPGSEPLNDGKRHKCGKGGRPDLASARARELSISKNGSTALFPALCDKNEGYVSANTVRKIKMLVEDEIGQKFDIRTCRRTYGQMLIDEGNSIETVSVTLGHATSRTTENYYCRRKQKAAIDEAKRIWSQKNDVPKNPQNISIRFEKYMSGYA
jgi:integrase